MTARKLTPRYVLLNAVCTLSVAPGVVGLVLRVGGLS